MKYEVWNFGSTRRFPSSAGNIEILRGKGFQTEDEELANYLGVFNRISVKHIGKEISDEKIENYDTMPAEELEAIASRSGIKNAIGQTKEWLIATIKGVFKDDIRT